MKRQIYLVLTLLLVVTAGCRRSYEYPSELAYADAMADTNAAAAQQFLNLLRQKMTEGSEADRMRYELLRVKAKSKGYGDLSADTGIVDLANYFKRHGSLREKMMAYYYRGMMERDRHDSPEALRWFQRATELGEKNIAEVDTPLLGRIYSQAAWLLQLQYNYPAALQNMKRCCEIEKRTPAAYSSTVELANVFYKYARNKKNATHYLDSAFLYYQEALRLLFNAQEKTASDTLESIGICSEILGFCIDNDYEGEMREKCASWLMTFPPYKFQYNTLYTKGLYYWKTARLDSAEFFWLETERKSQNKREAYSSAKALFRLYKETRQKDKAIHYAELMDAAYDTLANQRIYEQTMNTRNEYVYRQSAERDAAAKERRWRKRMWGYGALSALVFALGAAALWNRQQRLRLAEEKVAALREKEEMEARYQAELNLLREQTVDITDALESYKRATLKDEERAAEWKALCTSVAVAYPEFQTRIAGLRDALSPKDVRLLYLLRAGASQADIARMEGQTRQGVNMRVKALKEKLGAGWESVGAAG